jgi:hypothetical protein
MRLKQEVKLSVLNIDEGDDSIQFHIEISNGITFASLDFYGYADNFKEFAGKLLSFPKTIKDNVKYELGEVGERWAYYILLDVFCYESNGHSAVHVVVDNNGKRPYTNKSEFYISTVPASLNRFGQLLYSWNPLTEKEILWTAE